ncbi:MAG: tetratricopeptide repeat protein [Gallionella sp.]
MQLNRVWVLVLVLSGVTSALYGQFLQNPFVFDDLLFFTVDDHGNVPVSNYYFSLFELRSLPYATLAWGNAWFGLDIHHFRIENLLLHAAVVLALFFFLTPLFEAVLARQDEPDRLGSRAMAFFASLLFALHPVATYAAGYLVQRTIVMATFFSLLAMTAYLYGSVRQKAPWLWMSVPLYYLAVFSKEHAIMLPAVLMALTILLHEDWRAKFKQRWALFLVLAAIAVFVVAAKKGILGSVYEVDPMEMRANVDSTLIYQLSVLTQAWLFFKYLVLWLFPNPAWMSIDMREPFAQSLWSFYLAAFAAFLAWGACAVRLLVKRGRLGLIGLAMLFPWLMFMTEMSVVRIQENFVLYRSYLWAVGACCLLPFLLDKLNKNIASVIVSMVALAMFPIAMERLATLSHPLLLWNDAEKLVADRDDLPGAARIYSNRGIEFLKIKSYKDATRDFNRAIHLLPTMPSAYNNLGATYLELGEWQAAITSFGKAIEVMQASGKWDSRPFLGRAMAFERLGETENARRDYETSCRLTGRGCEKL